MCVLSRTDVSNNASDVVFFNGLREHEKDNNGNIITTTTEFSLGPRMRVLECAHDDDECSFKLTSAETRRSAADDDA